MFWHTDRSSRCGSQMAMDLPQSTLGLYISRYGSMALALVWFNWRCCCCCCWGYSDGEGFFNYLFQPLLWECQSGWRLECKCSASWTGASALRTIEGVWCENVIRRLVGCCTRRWFWSSLRNGGNQCAYAVLNEAQMTTVANWAVCENVMVCNSCHVIGNFFEIMQNFILKKMLSCLKSISIPQITYAKQLFEPYHLGIRDLIVLYTVWALIHHSIEPTNMLTLAWTLYLATTKTLKLTPAQNVSMDWYFVPWWWLTSSSWDDIIHK